MLCSIMKPGFTYFRNFTFYNSTAGNDPSNDSNMLPGTQS